MSALSIRRQLCWRQHQLALIAAVLALAGAIAAHHSGLQMDMDHDTGMGAAVQMCLGVFTAVGVALAAIGLAGIARACRRAVAITLPAVSPPALGGPCARARHGPDRLSLLCVSRR